MCPWVSEVEIEGVAVFLWGEVRIGRGGDEVAELARLATELTIGDRDF